jgi:hypothetical protein
MPVAGVRLCRDECGLCRLLGIGQRRLLGGRAHAAPGVSLWGQDEGRCVCERWQKPPSRKLRVDVDLSSTSPARSSAQGPAEAV